MKGAPALAGIGISRVLARDSQQIALVYGFPYTHGFESR
jgi:hypothetical protein